MGTKNQSLLLLGTNLGQREQNIALAKQYIQSSKIIITNETKIIETKPIGFLSENLFKNQIIEVSHSYSPIQLLGVLHGIEKKVGRTEKTNQKSKAYTDREIDLDILSFNELKFDSDQLTIPHHQLYSRAFVKELLTLLPSVESDLS